MNDTGLRAAKKKTLVTDLRGGHKEIYQMEDVTAVLGDGDKWQLLAVMDGHAGRKCADATKELLPAVARPFLSDESLTAAGLRWTELFAALDAKLKERKVKTRRGEELDEFDSEGCTCTLVALWRNPADGQRFVQAANVGDSNAVLVRGGAGTLMSREHKVSDPLERRRLIDAGMKLRDDQNRLPQLGLALSRMLGDFCAKEIYPMVNAVPYVHELP